ncbi:hypothetical protein ACIGD1_27795 [Streptomyces sp. NPDC085612]|uniref:hypothetical protein n=1 Tax=Streptomyces sp. NPDC085612 TaxID=3365732 RepID=UPI0037D25328
MTDNSGAVAARLGIVLPPDLRFDVRVQRPDTLYLAKTALREMREQYRNRGGGDGR